jgi:hypothetical protein
VSLRVIDCSRHDNDRRAALGHGDVLDFRAAKAAGVHAAVVRWGVGNSRDPYFTRNLYGVLAAGLWPGAYWVPYPGNDQQADAARVLTDVRSICGGLDGVAVTVDVEDISGLHITRAEYNTCAAALTHGAGHPQLDYIPRWWLSASGWTDLPTATPWWDSRYPYGDSPPPAGFDPQPLAPYGGWTPRLWQYTSSSVIPGMSDRTDVSAFFGTEADWAAMTGQETDDMTLFATVEEFTAAVRAACRAALNEGTAQGQLNWAGTSKATLATAQTLTNKGNALAADVDQVQAVLAQVAAAVAAVHDGTDELSVQLGALALLPVEFTAEQIQMLAAALGIDYDRLARIAAAAGIDYARVAAMVQFTPTWPVDPATPTAENEESQP